MPKKMKLAIVAGETSGDTIGADFLREMHSRSLKFEALGIGGSRMQSQGFKSLYEMEKLSIRGYVEVLKSLPELVLIRSRLKRQLMEYQPDIFVGIDAPDFNLHLEFLLKKNGIKTIQYVSPSIWAWRKNRIKKIGKSVDKVLTLFPFENKIYEKHGIPVNFVGHPLADSLSTTAPNYVMRKELELNNCNPVVSLLPGSRQSEVEQLAPVMVAAADILVSQFSEIIFLVPLVSSETINVFDKALNQHKKIKKHFRIMHGHSTEALSSSDVALIASGTATLEAALLGVPMVITYKMPKISEWIMRFKKTDLPYVGLPNILSDSYIVPELLLEDANAENLSCAVYNLLNDTIVRNRLREQFGKIALSLKKNASARAVDAVMDLLAPK